MAMSVDLWACVISIEPSFYFAPPDSSRGFALLHSPNTLHCAHSTGQMSTFNCLTTWSIY